MKKILASLLTVFLFGMNFLPALAVESSKTVKDVANNYWAKSSIDYVLNNGIMKTDEKGNFNPEKSLTRVEFVQALLKILSDDNLNIKIKNKFTDVKDTDSYYYDVLRSEQLGLIYGYPDNTFKPNQNLLRSETTSVISHITKDIYTDCTILDKFSDKNLIPEWSKVPYAKSISFGIYVNHPNENALEPNRDITRAETAVLLTKLKDKLTYVKPQYLNQNEQDLSLEHLNIYKKATSNIVKVTSLRKIIRKGNVLDVQFDSLYESQKYQVGDKINFVLPQALYTDEGTFILPAKTKFIAEIVKIKPAVKFNKNTQVSILFKQAILPDGRTADFQAVPLTKNNVLKESKWLSAGKIALSTISLGTVSSGAGVGFSFINTPKKFSNGIAAGVPVAPGLGIITGSVTPGLNYRAKAGEQIKIMLTEDASIYDYAE